MQRAPRSLPARTDSRPSQRERGVALSPPRYGIESVDRAGQGQALPSDLRGKMERSFASDLSRVRVHQGDEATRIGARAFARGSELHFAPGHYQPNTLLGQARIGHELAHVIQQSSGRAQARRSVAGVGVDDSRGLEAQADLAGARAALGRPAGLSGRVDAGAGASPVVQREVEGNNLRQVLDWQMRLQQAAKDHPETHSYKYTTVGFEHEFAQMSDGPLHGVDHLELSRSTAPVLPFTNIPFVLETDASNSVELVSPPFLIATRATHALSSKSNRQPVPLADDIEKIDGFFRAELQDAIVQARRQIRTPRPGRPGLFDYSTAYDNKTLTDVTTALRNSTGIDFAFRDVQVEPYQLSPATVGSFDDQNDTVTGATLGGIHIKPSSKGPIRVHDGERGNIITQINFATTAKIADRLQRASDRQADLRPTGADGITSTFRNVEAAVRALLIGATNPSNKLRRFYNALARALSGQLAVPYLGLVRDAQLEAMEWGVRLAALDDYTSAEIGYAESIGSHVKDTSGVWIKDMVLNLGLERLSQAEWRTVLARLTDAGLVDQIKAATMVAFPAPPAEHVAAPLVPPATALERLAAAHEARERARAVERAADRRAAFRLATGDATVAALARIATLIDTQIKPEVGAGFRERVQGLHFGQGDGPRLEFGQHDPANVGPRQDTYIKSQNVQNNLWATRRLHVVETRGDSLEKQLELIRLVGG
ncbi:DUF4157 domain-containing protein [Nannocystaceae bacterium ST9]